MIKKRLTLSKQQIRILAAPGLDRVRGAAATDDTQSDLCSIAVCSAEVCHTDAGCGSNPCTGTWDSKTVC